MKRPRPLLVGLLIGALVGLPVGAFAASVRTGWLVVSAHGVRDVEHLKAVTLAAQLNECHARDRAAASPWPWKR